MIIYICQPIDFRRWAGAFPSCAGVGANINVFWSSSGLSSFVRSDIVPLTVLVEQDGDCKDDCGCNDWYWYFVPI